MHEDSKVADGVLARAAFQGRRIALITDYGLVRGYILGLDQRSLVIYAEYRATSGGETVSEWSTVVLPRDLAIFLESSFIFEEEADIQKGYWQHGGHTMMAVYRKYISQVGPPDPVNVTIPASEEGSQ